MAHRWIGVILVALGVITMAVGPAYAGEVFITGHDPDFHAQSSTGAENLLRSGLNFVTDGTYNDGNNPATKFLWVESRIPVPGGHLVGEAGLTAIGLVLGRDYDRADATEFASVNLSNYTAIAIASSFGGLLRSNELNALIARKADITNFVNAGGGVLALAECVGSIACDPTLMAGVPAAALYSYLPVTVSSIAPSPPFNVTPAGAAAPFNLTNADVNDPTHNSFGLIGGLIPLDLDQASHATTLAGNVRIEDGGFVPVAEPSVLGVAALGLASVVAWRRARRR
jgi:hypothetical protein